MSKIHLLMEDKPGLRRYEIRVKGYLNEWWADWFEGLTITLDEKGNTLLHVQSVDQAALHALLKKVRDLGLILISVNSIDPHTQEGSEQ